MEFAVSADLKVKIKESKKNKKNNDKYLDLTRELKSIKLTALAILVGALWMIHNSLEKRLENWRMEGEQILGIDQISQNDSKKLAVSKLLWKITI